jgi:hypothetical protein
LAAQGGKGRSRGEEGRWRAQTLVRALSTHTHTQREREREIGERDRETGEIERGAQTVAISRWGETDREREEILREGFC